MIGLGVTSLILGVLCIWITFGGPSGWVQTAVIWRHRQGDERWSSLTAMEKTNLFFGPALVLVGAIGLAGSVVGTHV